MQDAKAAKRTLFKDFCNAAEMEKNFKLVDFILSSFLRLFLKTNELQTFLNCL